MKHGPMMQAVRHFDLSTIRCFVHEGCKLQTCRRSIMTYAPRKIHGLHSRLRDFSVEGDVNFFLRIVC